MSLFFLEVLGGDIDAAEGFLFLIHMLYTEELPFAHTAEQFVLRKTPGRHHGNNSLKRTQNLKRGNELNQV